MLETVAGTLPLLHQLAFKLWAMRKLPPRSAPRDGRDRVPA